jgi:hypothetical protein
MTPLYSFHMSDAFIGGSVMHITEEDAALMYARACFAWYGPNATRIVRKRIRELERANDAPGVRI